MEMELPGKRKRGRPKKRFLDVVKEVMGEVGAKKTDDENRMVQRKIICCGYPCLKGKGKRIRSLTNDKTNSLLDNKLEIYILCR